MTCSWAASAEGLPQVAFPSSLLSRTPSTALRMMLPLWVDPSGRLGLFSHQQDGQLGGTELQGDAKSPDWKHLV